MEELMDDVIQLDGSIAVKEASDAVKPIADNEIKNSLYHHILATEGVWKYLNDNDIINCEPVNLRSCSKFLSEFEYTDIQLPNLSVCVRAVYDEEILFIPKSHFEAKITPDVYLFVKVDNELKTGKVLGFVKPDQVNKKNDNGKYYFVNKSFLKSFTEFIELIKNSNIKEQYLISDTAEDTIEKIIVKYFDNDIDKTKKQNLFDYLINSSIAREKLIEFENFERLSYMSLKEFKDLDVENNDFTKYIKTLFPKDEFSDFGENEDLEENAKSEGGLYIDDDLLDKTENTVTDEFKIFEDNTSEFSETNQDEKFDDEEFTNKSIDDIPLETDEDVVVPEDLELNVLDDINEQSKGLDADTVIGLTEDVMYEGDTDNQEVNLPQDLQIENELQDEKELNELDLVTNEEVDRVIDEVTSQELTETQVISEEQELPLAEMQDEPQESVEISETSENPEISEIVEASETSETVETSEISGSVETLETTETSEIFEAGEMPENSDEPSVSDSYTKIFDDADADMNFVDGNKTVNVETQISDNGLVEFESDNDNDEGMIKTSNDVNPMVNDDSKDLNEIYDENTEVSEEISAQNTIESEPSVSEVKDTDFAFATYKGFTMSKKVAVGISAGVLILCLAGIGAWYFLFQNKSSNNNIANNESVENANVSDVSFDIAGTEQNSQNNIDNLQIAKDNSGVSANVQLPAQLPPSLEKDNSSEQISIQKIKKDFTKPDTYVSVSKIVWDVPEYMTYNDELNSYLQTVGSSLKVNLSSDLLLINESPILNSVKLRITLKNNARSYSASIIQGCGTQSIDDLVLQSVKKTMDIIKPPVNDFDTADEDLYLTICL